MPIHYLTEAPTNTHISIPVSNNNNNNNNNKMGEECDSSTTWYNAVTTFSWVGAAIAIGGIGELYSSVWRVTGRGEPRVEDAARKSALPLPAGLDDGATRRGRSRGRSLSAAAGDRVTTVGPHVSLSAERRSC